MMFHVFFISMNDSQHATAMTVTMDGHRLIAVHSAYGSVDCDRLRDEAEILRQLDHPGIVRLVDHTEGPPARLRTIFVGPETWRTEPPIDEEVASSLSTVCATVADIHDSGLTHGDLRAEHVLVDSSGTPVLCGFARATAADSTTIAADVEALVSLGRELAPRAGVERAAIETILAALEAGREDLRGTIRSLDQRRLPPASPPGPIDRRSIAAAGGCLAVMSIVALIAVVVLRSTDSTTPPEATVEPSLEFVEDTHPTTTGPSPVVSADPPTVPRPVPNALELRYAGRRYAIGRVGDIVVVDDWNCDGTPTPALLRPTTGAVAVFGQWPAAGATVEPVVATVIADATDLVATDQECPLLRVVTSTGSRLITPPESS
ncbi:MAG: hypothetical protein ACPHIC_08200 [Acidimicrobiales bacterium]